MFLGTIPPIMRELVAGRVRKGIRKTLYAQGMGRHSRDEIYEIGKADLTAVSVWLGEKPFFMGATATSVDASAYSFPCQYPRASAEISVAGSRKVSSQFVGLLRADEDQVL